MNCISRKDKDINLFSKEKNGKGRWNLYSRIAIENNSVVCAKESYLLTSLCFTDGTYRTQPCTLQGTNENVDLGHDRYIRITSTQTN